MAVCLILTLLPATALAVDEGVSTAPDAGTVTAVTGVTQVSSEKELREAIQNARDGDTIQLAQDIQIVPVDCGEDTLYPHITINKNLSLDLNGKTISWDLTDITDETEFTCTIAFFAVDGADVIITGNGTIDAEAKMNNSYGINIIDGGTVTIQNGTFTGATSAVQVQKGTLTILGGTFKQAETIGNLASNYASFVINCIDSAFKDGTARISLRGGTYCYDYSKNPEGAGTTYIAAGYESTTSDNKTWTVSAKTAMDTEQTAVSEEGTASTTVGGNYTGSDTTVTVEAETSNNTTSTEVTIASNTLETVVGNTDVQNMEIKTDVGTLTVTKDALSSMKENATTGTVEVPVVLDVILSVSKDENVYTLEAKNTLGEPVYAEDLYRAGNVTVTVPYAGSTAYVYYLSAKGPVLLPEEDVTVGGGFLSWTVDHFSDYAVLSGEAVASVTDENGKVTLYDSLQAAINAAGEKATVTLLQDTQENVNIPADKDIVLELNGKTLDGGTTSSTAALTNHGTVVIQDSSAAGTGTIKRSDNGSTGCYYTVYNYEGTMTIKSGNIRNNAGSSTTWSGSSLICNGLNAPATLNIEGGNIQQDNFIAVKNDEQGTLNITGGVIKSKTQAVQNWCEADISGGEMTGSVTTWAYDNYDGNTLIRGDAQINGDVGAYWYNEDSRYPVQPGVTPTVTMTGGTVTGNLLKGSTTNGSDTEQEPDESATGSIAVSGGEFGNSVNPLYLDTDLNYEANNGQVYSYHKTFDEAVEAAGNNGSVSVTRPEAVETVTLSKLTRPGYIFRGWQAADGTVYPAGTELAADKAMGLTPLWEEREYSSSGSSSSTTRDYAVTVDAGKHGDVSVSPKWAEEGDTVTITADPDNGYVVDEVIVTDKNGDSVRVRDRGDGEYTFTMPNSKVTVEVTFVEVGDELSFVDVAKSDYYYDAVKWAVDNGVTTGVTDTIFAPGNPCTRAQTVTFLWRAAGMPQAANRVNPFTDVSESDYYYEAVLWAVENGITGGTTATTFSPNATCTRAQVVTFLWRYSKEDASILPMFTDVAEGDYYYGAVAWAVENGVTTGVTDTSFVPGNPCTRGQIVTFLYRYMGK